MEENLEKYRALYNLLNDSTKSSLFGDGQPFGRNSTDRKLFGYFTDWIDELGREKQLNPITVNSNTFIAHLNSIQKDENPEIAQIVNDIRRYHENKVISDEPLNNTLYQFAEIVDELKVTSDSEAGDVFSRYNDALSVASKLPPMGEHKVSPVSSESQPVQEKNTEKSEVKPEGGNKSESGRKSESGSESKSTIKSESSSSSEVNLDAESESTTKTTSTTTGQKSVPGNGSYAKSQPLDRNPANNVQTTQPAHPVQSAQPAKSIQPTSATLPTQPAEPAQPTKRGLNLHDEALTVKSSDVNDETSARKPQSANTFLEGDIFIKKPGKRIVHKVMGKKGLRRTAPVKNGGQQKLTDPKEQGQNRQNAQAGQPATTPEATPEAEQFYNNQPNRIAEAAQLAQNQPENKSNFGGRLKKVAIGSGVMGGGLFSLFSDDTAEAASTIANHTIPYLKPIINFIHLFLQ